MVDFKKLKEEQSKLAKKAIVKDDFEKLEIIGGVDQAYFESKVISAIVLCDYKTNEVKEKVYAISAGREIRIFVTPEKIGDMEARNLAREVAIKIEHELKYPGEIKVTVIRESRVIEYAR